MIIEQTGADLSTIAVTAGVARRTIGAVLNNPRVARVTETAVLQLTVDAVSEQWEARRYLRDPGPVRDHIKSLLTFEDCTLAAIVAATGIGYDAIVRIKDGQVAGVTASTVQAVRRLTPYLVRRNAAFVSSRRAITRLRALQAAGHTLRSLSDRLGHAAKDIPCMRTGKITERITQENDRRIEHLYRELESKPGPSDRAKAHARRLGYYPPIHYDEDMRLIPDSIPDKRWIPLSSPEDRARTNLRIMGLTLRDLTGAQIAARVGYSSKKVERIRREVGLRLEPNACDSILLDYIKPGQDALVALIRQQTQHLDLNEALPMVDLPGMDYVALWDGLCLGAERLRAEAEAWEEYAARESWIPSADLAGVA
jgi:hypothetical protein